MFGEALGVLDRLLSIRKAQIQTDKAWMDQLIAPAFVQLEAVHTNYLGILYDAAAAVEAGNSKAALDKLSKARIEFLPIREKLLSFVTRRDLPEWAALLLRHIDRYFNVQQRQPYPPIAFCPSGTPSTLIHNAIMMMESDTAEDGHRMAKYIRRVADVMGTDWRRICDEYAALQAETIRMRW